MEKNIKLLNETLDFIKTNPKLHHQGDWVEAGQTEAEYQACETTMCFAGHAALLAGGTFDKTIWFDEFEWEVDEETGQHKGYADDDDSLIHVSTFAAEKLGLNDDERCYLFDSSRTIQDIEKAVRLFGEGWTVSWNGDFYKKDEEN